MRLHIERLGASGAGAVAMSVEDDGGGSSAQLQAAPGYGILGIRERVAALGGSLSIDQAGRGVRVAALIPLLASHTEPAAALQPA